MVKDKQKFALWLTPEAKEVVERHFEEDNCGSRSEYIEKAIRFYSGYLDAEHADAYLPRVLSEVLEGKLGDLGTRIGRLIFKLAVDETLMSHLLAYALEVDPDDLKKLRAQCVKEVKETNGEISFQDTLRFQKGSGE